MAGLIIPDAVGVLFGDLYQLVGFYLAQNLEAVVGPDDQDRVDDIVIAGAEIQNRIDRGLEATDGEGFLVKDGILTKQFYFLAVLRLSSFLLFGGGCLISFLPPCLMLVDLPLPNPFLSWSYFPR